MVNSNIPKYKESKDMKRCALVLVAVLLLLSTLVGCGTFSYDITDYVEMGDYKNLTLKSADIDKKLQEETDSLLDTYKGETILTEGTVEKGNTVYIYYAGTVFLYKGNYKFTVGKSDFAGLDEALKEVEFKDGVATVTVTMAEDFKMPAFVSDYIKDKIEAVKEQEKAESATTSPSASQEPATDTPSAETSAKESASATPDSEPQAVAPIVREEASPASESTTASPSTSDDEDKAFVAGKKVTFILTVNGKNGKVADGEELDAELQWTYVFDGGTYNADSSAEKKKTDEDKKGFALEIGSGKFIDGFEDAMIGMSVVAGTKKTLELNFPSEYKSNTNLSGLDVNFDVEILSVSNFYKRDMEDAEQFAALKEDFEKANGKESFDYTDKKDYDEKVRVKVRENLAVEAYLKLCKVKKWKYSDLEDYTNQVKNQYLNQYLNAYLSYGLSVDQAYQYASQYISQNEQKIVNAAGEALKQDLVLYQIAKEQGLTEVSSEEYNEYVDTQVKETNAYYEATETKDSDGNILKVSKSDIVDSFTNGKEGVKKAIVLNRAIEWLGAHITEK